MPWVSLQFVIVVFLDHTHYFLSNGPNTAMIHCINLGFVYVLTTAESRSVGLASKPHLRPQWLRLLSIPRWSVVVDLSLLFLPLFEVILERVCFLYLFCNAVLNVLSNFAIILLRKREIIALL